MNKEEALALVAVIIVGVASLAQIGMLMSGVCS